MRQQRFNKLLLASLIGLASASAMALEFRSVAEHGAVFYDAPSTAAKKLFVTSKGLPVEVLIDNKDWVRVRDQSGVLAWTEKKSLANKRTVVIAAPKARIQASADAKANALITVEKNVMLDLLEAGKAGWIKVRHRDGAVGYLRIEEVWGL